MNLLFLLLRWWPFQWVFSYYSKISFLDNHSQIKDTISLYVKLRFVFLSLSVSLCNPVSPLHPHPISPLLFFGEIFHRVSVDFPSLYCYKPGGWIGWPRGPLQLAVCVILKLRSSQELAKVVQPIGKLVTLMGVASTSFVGEIGWLLSTAGLLNSSYLEMCKAQTEKGQSESWVWVLKKHLGILAVSLSSEKWIWGVLLLCLAIPLSTCNLCICK